MAANCEKEKRAFTKAEGRVGECEAQWDKWERKAVLSEERAQRYPADLNRRCRDEGEECFIDGWLIYRQLLHESLGLRAVAENLQSKWERAIIDEEKAKEKYHRCLDRKRSR